MFPTPTSTTDARSWFDLVNQVANCNQLRDLKAPFKPYLSPRYKLASSNELAEAFQASMIIIMIMIVDDYCRNFIHKIRNFLQAAITWTGHNLLLEYKKPLYRTFSYDEFAGNYASTAVLVSLHIQLLHIIEPSWPARNRDSIQLKQLEQITCRNVPFLMQTRWERKREGSMTSLGMLLLGSLLLGRMTTASTSSRRSANAQCQPVVIITEGNCHHSSTCTDQSVQPWNGWYWLHESESALLPDQHSQQEVVVLVVCFCNRYCCVQRLVPVPLQSSCWLDATVTARFSTTGGQHILHEVHLPSDHWSTTVCSCCCWLASYNGCQAVSWCPLWWHKPPQYIR